MDGRILEILSKSRDQTYGIGRAMAGFLEAGDVVALTGELGSGKTVFVQGVCDGLEVEDCVTSPTFTLIQEYAGRLPVRHFDFYRLESIREIEDLDLAWHFQGGNVCLIEWAEKGRAFYPEDHFKVELSRVSEHGRPVTDFRRIRIFDPRCRLPEGIRA